MTAIPLSRTIEYPESDGRPMAETQAHGQVLLDLYHALSQRYAEVPDVYVWFNMLLYFVQGDPRACVAPDVFLVRGVDKRERRTYKVWEEGRAPSLVCEVTSKSTRDEDVITKKEVYERLGVEEYFLFDPLVEYLRPSLQGYRLIGGRYQGLAPQRGGSLESRTTGLRFVVEGKRLRLRDAETDEPLPWQEEDVMARRAAEREAEQQTRIAEEERRSRAVAERDAEEARRARAVAEQRARALEEELARLRRGL
ncbi:MAG TPA: Uma2 family endonuclease [Thermoanaerobaculia bacterium]|jgi:Uma2 family endonuclease|nr:Uma2 family endonuclease [Thermoanaerobaculia bacterium]